MLKDVRHDFTDIEDDQADLNVESLQTLHTVTHIQVWNIYRYYRLILRSGYGMFTDIDDYHPDLS